MKQKCCYCIRASNASLKSSVNFATHLISVKNSIKSYYSPTPHLLPIPNPPCPLLQKSPFPPFLLISLLRRRWGGEKKHLLQEQINFRCCRRDRGGGGKVTLPPPAPLPQYPRCGEREREKEIRRERIENELRVLISPPLSNLPPFKPLFNDK